MNYRITPLLALSLAGLALAGCAGDQSRYPSLAIRDIEKAGDQRVHGTLQPETVAEDPSAPPPVPAGLTERLQQLEASARAAHRDFLAIEPTAQRRTNLARGAAAGSENWFAAQLALAELDSARSRVTTALADLDALHVRAELDGAGLATIAAVRNTVEVIAADEDRTVTGLAAQLSPR